MPRPFFPHTLHDLTHAVDGTFGLVVGDMPDGSLWVLKRDRKSGGYTLSHWADTARSRLLSQEQIIGRVEAINTMAAAIGMPERLTG